MEPGLASAHSGVGLFNERVLYLIRLPLFVVVSGLLMSTSVERRGTWRYLWARLVDLMWVYLLWTLLQGGVEVITSPFKNVPTTWAEVANLWVPRAQLWYLPFLMIISVLIVATKPWRGGWRLMLGLALGFAISLVDWGHDGTTILTRGMSLAIFIFAGASLGRQRLFALWDRATSGFLAGLGIVAVPAAVMIGLGTSAIMPTSDRLGPWTLHGVLLGMLGATLGVVGVSSLVVLVCRWWAGFQRGAAYLGRHAMAIYLGHITAMAGVRIVLLRLGVDSVTVHVVAGTVIGTMACLLIVWIAKYIPWLLNAPRPLMPTNPPRPTQ